MKLKLAILASGSGSNAQAIIEACQANIINADVKLVFTNKADAKVLQRAQNLGVKSHCLSHKDFANREEYDKALLKILQEHDVDTIAMAGYMRIVSPLLIDAYRDRIINVHPAILPAFPGAHGILDAKNWGVKLFGLTVHFVDEIMDNGSIIIQAALPADFSTAEAEEITVNNLHTLEHKCFVQALTWLADERLVIEGRNVKLKENKDVSYEQIPNALVFPFLERKKTI